ncbi:MAG: PA0069 family radical SAM protein [Calditrichaeota bacterium]|nr:MAG: PA0069 family radical SAM protein [Calditrichota bacterium]
MKEHKAIKGRGASKNPPNRFDKITIEINEAFEEEGVMSVGPHTQFYEDKSKTIITYNKSPDVRFDASINIYRGCEHGCIYCYARPTHEYLGLSIGLDFESKIFVKKDAPGLLAQELSAKKWEPQILGISGVTDAYQPVERSLQLTRQCLQVLKEFRNPVTIITKNFLITRDIDILSSLAKHQAVSVCISICTLDNELVAKLEPRTSRPEKRLKAIRMLSEAGIPVGVLVAPVIPGLTDHEIPEILRRAAGEGAHFASYTLIRLPYGVKKLFVEWLEKQFPHRAGKILSRISSIRGGKLNESQFHERMGGRGEFAEQIRQLFRAACNKYHLSLQAPSLSTKAYRRTRVTQLNLFD